MKDGKIVADKLKAKMMRWNLDAEKQAALKTSIDKCATVTDSDKCEVAANFMKCMLEDEKI